MANKSCLNRSSLETEPNSSGENLDHEDQMDCNFLLSKLNFSENNHLFDETNNSLKSVSVFAFRILIRNVAKIENFYEQLRHLFIN